MRVRYIGGRASWATPAPSSGRGAIAWTGVEGAQAGGRGVHTGAAVAQSLGGSGTGTHEGLLMHAGTARFRRPVELRDAGIISARGEHTVFIVARQGFEERRVFGRQQVLVRVGDHALLRRRLTEELLERGASEADARALLDARQDTLLSGERSHALYFLPREVIDRALPMTVQPAPAAVVRVRLVDDYR